MREGMTIEVTDNNMVCGPGIPNLHNQRRKEVKEPLEQNDVITKIHTSVTLKRKNGREKMTRKNIPLHRPHHLCMLMSEVLHANRPEETSDETFP
jgi:hypothetical protein